MFSTKSALSRLKSKGHLYIFMKLITKKINLTVCKKIKPIEKNFIVQYIMIFKKIELSDDL